MVDWNDFAREAPRIAEVFVRRHTATGNLCLLATMSRMPASHPSSIASARYRASALSCASEIHHRLNDGEYLARGAPDQDGRSRYRRPDAEQASLATVAAGA